LDNKGESKAPTEISSTLMSSDKQPTTIKPNPFIIVESKPAEEKSNTPLTFISEQSIGEPSDKQAEAAHIASRSQAAKPKHSLFARYGRLRWAGAVIILIAAVGICIAMMSKRRPVVASETSSVVESISSQADANEASSEEEATSTSTQQETTAAQAEDESTTAPVEEGANGAADSSSIAVAEKSKPIRPTRDREPANYEPAEPAAITVENPLQNAPATRSAAPPEFSVITPQQTTNQPMTASADDNKPEEKKKKGGFFKKLGSLFKSDDKNKEKKP
jgi:hypothetical protein